MYGFATVCVNRSERTRRDPCILFFLKTVLSSEKEQNFNHAHTPQMSSLLAVLVRRAPVTGSHIAHGATTLSSDNGCLLINYHTYFILFRCNQ